MKGKCEICHDELEKDELMCKSCCRSYDRYSFKDCSVYSAIVWAARRAWRMSAKREREDLHDWTSFFENSTLTEIDLFPERTLEDELNEPCNDSHAEDRVRTK